MSNERRRQGPRGPMGHGMRGNGEKAKNFKGTLKKLFVYLKPYYFKLAVVIIFAVGSTIFTIVGPKILAKATDKLSEIRKYIKEQKCFIINNKKKFGIWI